MSFAHNLALVDEEFLRFTKDPSSCHPTWRAFFEGVAFGEQEKGASKELRIYHLIMAYRTFGHLLAIVNPVATKEPELPYALTFETLGFQESERTTLFPTLGLLEEKEAPLEKIIATLKEIYSGSVGIEYMHLPFPRLKQWLQEKIEPIRFRPSFSPEKKQGILTELNKSTFFEVFLHTKYVGQTRFSLEGGETLIPILHEVIEEGAKLGGEEFVIGMAHRGRLNVLANILNKSYAMIFGEFEGFYDPVLAEESGDVKYHKGYSSDVVTQSGKEVHITLSPNPSHLESVNPVVEGKVRGRQTLKNDDKREKVIPILIHGDASLSGQGVVYETMQLYKLKGYATGGTIHVVVNNQIGFTTLAEDSRSTFYCTSIARSFSAPVFHVNAEDPEGCVFATQLALYIRQKYHCDVFIDMNCYRKYGHNEGDEPFFTQPREYDLIRKKKSIRELYLDKLIQEGIIGNEEASEWEKKFKEGLHHAMEDVKRSKEAWHEIPFQGEWEGYHKATKKDLFTPVNTQVSENELDNVSLLFSKIPETFSLHPKLEKVVQERLSGLKNNAIDWGMAEHLAFGTLLKEGVPLRLAGEDSGRGTFSQRHALWVDQKNGEKFFPLSQVGASFEVVDSPLSEFAGLAFEYGYSLACPKALVLWEAQYGDFVNGAQIVIDQYIVPGEHKWARYSGLVLLLPHGYEGRGPEHSSARLERFLQLAGSANIQVVNPTTPAQYFHLLRRQVLRPIRKPLVVFTPKGFLRHPKCISTRADFSKGSFQEILDDDNKSATRILLCSGRIFYDLQERKEKEKKDNIALIRIEQLYPLLPEMLEEVLQRYKDAQEILWVQDEPRNMGAWSYLYPIFHAVVPKHVHFNCISRKRAASPATGSHQTHVKEHEEIMQGAFYG